MSCRCRVGAPLTWRGKFAKPGLVALISGSTLWRWLHQDAIRPWYHRSWIFPKDPDFAGKAGRLLDLYSRQWEDKPLKADEFVISADEKTKCTVQQITRQRSRSGISLVMGDSLELSVVDRRKIQEWIAAHGTPQQVALRCRIVLGASEGEADSAIARRLSVNRNTVILWRKRFVEFGLDGLWDIAPGRGRKPTYELDKITAIVNATLQSKPAGMTHWSCRTLAEQQGVSKSTVNNIWRAHNLQPHRTETFKLSRDPKFLEKMTDVVGLYLNPPRQAIVLCVDEKSQIQALDRTQPGLPMKKGRCGTMTHDYKRPGTTTLFAALETLQGRVVGECRQRHRHQEFLKFLRRLDREFPGTVPLHLIMDNYGTHKHQKVREWLKRHPRFVPHFVPTSSSWMNLVERWFGHLDNKAIKRAAFLSVADLQTAIAAFLNTWNESPKPFVWTATIDSIHKKLFRCRRTLEQIQPGCTSPKRRKRTKVTV